MSRVLASANKFAIGFFVWIICSQALLADGVILDGVSAYTIGRGGTNLGFADNGSMLHDNPGAMGQMFGDEMLQIGATSLITEFYYSDPDNNARSQHQLYALPEIAYIKRFSDEWAFGAGIFTPAGFGSIYTLEGPAPFTGPQNYESFGSLSKILFGASYTPTEYISFGGTIGPAVSFVNLEGPYTLQGPSLAGTPTMLDLGLDGTGLAWSLGISCQLTDCTSIGFAYQSQTKIRAHGTATVTVPGVGSSNYNVDAKIKWPSSFGGGLRHQLTERSTISFDAVWYNWSDAFDAFDLSLHSGTNGSLPTAAQEAFPLRWRDTLTTRVGYEYLLCNGHTARLGYSHHKSAIPTSTITPFIPAALEHAFAAGYGFSLKGWDVNLAYMYSFGPTVDVQTSGLIGGDFNQSTHRNRTHAFGFSFTKVLGRSQCCECESECGCR